MRLRSLILVTLFALTAPCDPAIATSDNYRSSPDSGSAGGWSVLTDWEVQNSDGEWSTPDDRQGPPGPGDDANVRSGHTMIVDDDVTIDSLRIEDNARVEFGGAFTLEIADPGGLTIEPAATAHPGKLIVSAGSGDRLVKLTGGDSAAHRVDGQLRLQGSTSYLRIQNADAGIGGCGVIQMENASASIQIEPSRELTISSPLVVIGRGVINAFGVFGVATLRNHGSVMAAHPCYPGTLELGARLVIEDAAGACWVAGTSAINVLLFSKAQTCLHGDFEVRDHATISITTGGITTSGGFTCTNGGGVGGLQYECDCDSGVPSGCKQAMSCP